MDDDAFIPLIEAIITRFYSDLGGYMEVRGVLDIVFTP